MNVISHPIFDRFYAFKDSFNNAVIDIKIVPIVKSGSDKHLKVFVLRSL